MIGMGLPPRLLAEMKAYPAFLQKVWKACAAIPKGQVRSYSWIARRIGRPGAARAVGQALRRNPFAPRIPCHRVVPQAGISGGTVRPGAGLGGYTARGGVGTKTRLLRKEKALREAS